MDDVFYVGDFYMSVGATNLNRSGARVLPCFEGFNHGCVEHGHRMVQTSPRARGTTARSFRHVSVEAQPPSPVALHLFVEFLQCSKCNKQPHHRLSSPGLGSWSLLGMMGIVPVQVVYDWLLWLMLTSDYGVLVMCTCLLFNVFVDVCPLYSRSTRCQVIRFWWHHWWLTTIAIDDNSVQQIPGFFC